MRPNRKDFCGCSIFGLALVALTINTFGLLSVPTILLATLVVPHVAGDLRVLYHAYQDRRMARIMRQGAADLGAGKVMVNPWAPVNLAETLQVLHRGRDQGYSAERRQGRHRWGMAFLRAEAARMTARMRTWQIGLLRWATANPRVVAGAH